MFGEKFVLHRGVTIWLTGLSGAGKTTISRLLLEQLKKWGIKTEVLDGDEIRRQLTADLGFSQQDRQKNIAIVTFIAKLLTRNDIIVIASFVSPYREMRQYCRSQIGSFIEVYIKCPLEECMRRDVKGLYQRALTGQIKEFTGISAPYEEPDNPDIVVMTNKETPGESAVKILTYLIDRGYLQRG